MLRIFCLGLVVSTILSLSENAQAMVRTLKPNSEKDSGSIEYMGVKANLTYSKGVYENGRVKYLPMLTLSDGRQVVKVRGKENFYRSSMVQIAEMDKSNPFPEVIFSSYSGGTHCCTFVKIITSNKDGSSWRTVDVGRFDGESFEVKDPDGSGLYYYITDDDRFKYKFSSYAGSYPPIRVWQLNGTEIKDVSKESRFYPLHRQRLQSISDKVKAATGETEVHGLLAGYVATKIILNETKSAWELMLARYKKGDEQGLKECKGSYDDKGKCNGRLIEYTSFPNALQNFLIDTGYLQSNTILPSL
jgi:predicted DNA-binding antitoxin AbrB/MazE fold protein